MVMEVMKMVRKKKKIMRVVANFRWIILLFFFLNQGSVADQGDTDMNTAVEIGDVGTMLRIGIAKHSVERLIANNRSYRLSQHKPASNDRLAVRLYASREGIYVRQDLLVFERDTLIQAIPGITIDHVWSPDGNALVYMMADQPREIRNFANQIGIYDAKTKTHEVIIADVESQYARPLYLRSLNWAEFDGQIYVYNVSPKERVFRLDLDSKKLVLTDYKGIMFSPDGDCYFSHSTEGEPVVLYRRETNEEIWDGESTWPPFYEFIAWHKNERNETELYLRNRLVGIAVINGASGEIKIIRTPRRGAKPRFENGRISWQ